MTEFYRAREAFSLTSKSGLPRVITPGTLISSDDPDYKGREHLFEPVEVSVAHSAAARTETTSAAPGQLRSLGRKTGKKPSTQTKQEPPKQEPAKSEPAKQEATGASDPGQQTPPSQEPPKGDDSSALTTVVDTTTTESKGD